MAGRASEGTARTETARTTRNTHTRRAASAQSGRASVRSAGPKGKRAGRESRSERTREITALVLFGVAVFLFFALIATEKGGVVGRGIDTALVFAFGRLAFLVPLTLIAVAVTTVLEWRVWRSLRFWGIVVFLFGVFLLMAGGFPPFAGHGEELFVRADFEHRAGGLGEAFYGAVHSLTGITGVGIVGWLASLIGFGMVTGVTALWLGRRTQRAAQVVKTSAERSTLLTRRRGDDDGDGMYDADAPTRRSPWSAGWQDDTGSTGVGPTLGPVDLTQAAGAQVGGVQAIDGEGRSPGPFGDAFDDWTRGRPSAHSPLAPLDYAGSAGSGGVLDGAEVFSDLYGGPDQGTGVLAGSTGMERVTVGAPQSMGDDSLESMTADPGAVGAAAEATTSLATAPHGGLAPGASPVGAENGEDPEGSQAGPRQEALPGLAKPARRVEPVPAEPTYVLPEPAMLRKSAPAATGRGAGERDIATVLLQALAQFGVDARVIGMVVGPRVTRYELQLAPGTKVNKVSSLKDDLAYALATTEIRILAPIPGKSAVGVEIPNQRPDWVTLGDIYHEFPKSAGPLMVWLGKDISGKPVYADLTKLPHLLIAGTTGSGKSGCVNCIVSSVLLRSTPELVRMIMIDPKKVELSHYDRIPHLLVPVVTNMKDAAGVLHNVVKEMEDRYELMELDHARNLSEMNKTRARRGESPLPYILLVIDELADLMMAAPQEVEDYVIRLAQKSRAVGIHLVVATQRPSADVITGMIKANIPSRIAFAVSSQTDSRVILDVNGAETLLGMGDMLFKPLGSSHMQRVQGAYITEEEIAVLVNHWRHQAEPEFREELLRRPAEAKKSEEDPFDPDADDLLADAAQLVIETGSASVSMLQRRLRVGYTRAGRLIDMLERRGIVGPWEGSKPRQIMVEPDEVDNLLTVLRAEEDHEDGEAGD